MRLFDEAIHVGHVAVPTIDRPQIRDVVAEILLGRRLYGREPESIDAEIRYMVELLDDTGKIADPVPARIPEGTDIDLVENGAAPPFPPRHRLGFRKQRSARKKRLTGVAKPATVSRLEFRHLGFSGWLVLPNECRTALFPDTQRSFTRPVIHRYRTGEKPAS